MFTFFVNANLIVWLLIEIAVPRLGTNPTPWGAEKLIIFSNLCYIAEAFLYPAFSALFRFRPYVPSPATWIPMLTIIFLIGLIGYQDLMVFTFFMFIVLVVSKTLIADLARDSQGV
jgi:hypothetical protein